MSLADISAEDVCAIYVDMGTTNASGWLMRGEDIVARVCKPVGVRDSAREGSNEKIKATLKEIIGELQTQAAMASNSCSPVCIVAAGMIGSQLGLVELAHVPAPGG